MSKRGTSVKSLLQSHSDNPHTAPASLPSYFAHLLQNPRLRAHVSTFRSLLSLRALPGQCWVLPVPPASSGCPLRSPSLMWLGSSHSVLPHSSQYLPLSLRCAHPEMKQGTGREKPLLGSEVWLTALNITLPRSLSSPQE